MADGTLSGLLLGAQSTATAAVVGTVLGTLLGAVLGAVAGAMLARRRRRRGAGEVGPSTAAGEAAKIRAEALRERQVMVREAEIAARETALALRTEAEAGLHSRHLQLARLETALIGRELQVAHRTAELAETRSLLIARQAAITAHEAATEAARRHRTVVLAAGRAALERAAAETAEALHPVLLEAEREEARAHAAHGLRVVDQMVSDPELRRRAKRVMGISVGRFSGHYLTERHLSTVLIGEPSGGRPVIDEDTLQVIGSAANVRLALVQTQDAVRLEGLDGVGREVARRCLGWLLRRPGVGTEAVSRMAKEIAGNLDREVADLGRRAFAVLEIPRSHPEIVKLVGRLNYRTSYTQNQWKHAIEAALLCGMMAEEMGLDLKTARRAALIHDIGKALTHELDGSHAVIGADYARRLGESEVVANAIGAHHTDEPFNSPYAYLVAAADAMSGARPGARRQMEENYAAKLGDLERISRGFQGVGEAFAVQGGREVRVYVRQERVDDLAAVRMSSEIAETISREMTFPGQIRVTVIREFKAVETAN